MAKKEATPPSKKTAKRIAKAKAAPFDKAAAAERVKKIWPLLKRRHHPLGPVY